MFKVEKGFVIGLTLYLIFTIIIYLTTINYDTESILMISTILVIIGAILNITIITIINALEKLIEKKESKNE